MDKKQAANLIDALIDAASQLFGDDDDAMARLRELKTKAKNSDSEPNKEPTKAVRAIRISTSHRSTGKKAVKDHVTELPETWLIKTVGKVGKLNSRSNPQQPYKHRRLPQKVRSTTSPAKRTVKSQTASSAKKKAPKEPPSKADKRVKCGICGKKIAFKNLSKHRAREHAGASSASAKAGAQKRTSKTQTSKGNIQDTLRRMDDLKKQVQAINRRQT